MSARANTVNNQGIGVSTVAGGQVATAQTYVTTFPRPAGATILVTIAANGAAVNDNVERDSDGGLWSTTSNVSVRPENTNIGVNNLFSN